MADRTPSDHQPDEGHALGGEQGAALMTALLSAVFLVILGLVLLEVLKGGLAQAGSTEAAIQAEALAQRGIDDVTALVWDAVKEINDHPSPAYPYTQKVKDIEGKLNLLLVPFGGGKKVEGQRGFYTVEIAGDTNNYDDFAALHTVVPDYPYSRIITVKVTATAGTAMKRTVTKLADIHVTTINPVFKYPLSARTDIALSGAPFIVGDMLARDGKVYVFNKAYFVGSPDSQHAWETNWPTVKGFYKAQALERRDTQGSEPVTPDGMTFSHFEPFPDEQLPAAPDIPITDIVSAKTAEMNAALADPLLFQTVEEEVFGGYVIHSDMAISKKYTGQWVTIPDGEIEIGNGESEVRLAVEDGVLTMTPGANVTFRKGSLYVKYDNDLIAAATFSGSLEVAPPYAVVVQGDVVIEEGFHFKGNMFVDGSVQIVGSVHLEGTLYVSGSVDMKDMTSINFPDEDNDGIADAESAPLILLTGGQVLFSDSKNMKPIRIRAYLYSRKPMKLYGVVSKLHITGGVHGESVVLNALREDPDNKNAYWIDPDLDEPFHFTPTDKQLALPPDRSNLQIFFDPALFSDPPAGIPVTNELTMFVQSTLTEQPSS